MPKKKLADIKDYDDLIPKHPKRNNIYIKFYELLLLHHDKSKKELHLKKIALNIEKSIFNYTLSSRTDKSWNIMFETYYINNCVRVYINLNPESYLKNSNLINRLFNNEFIGQEIVYFDSEKMFPERHKELIKNYEDNLPKYSKEEEQPDSIHKCGNCASQKKPAYKTTYYQLQTRSAKIIGWKSTLLITSWLCYWENSCSPSLIIL